MTRQPQCAYPTPVILEVAFAARRHFTGLILGARVHLDLEQAERVADIILADEHHRPDRADYLTASDARFADSMWRAEQILGGHLDPGACRAASPVAARPSMPLRRVAGTGQRLGPGPSRHRLPSAPGAPWPPRRRSPRPPPHRLRPDPTRRSPRPATTAAGAATGGAAPPRPAARPLRENGGDGM